MSTEQDYPLAIVAGAASDLEDIFSSLPEEDPFEIKKSELAANLAALMVYANETRSSMAHKLNAKKSRITTILAGDHNLTTRTIWDFCSSIGYDFDVIFRKFDQSSPLQPWQKGHDLAIANPITHTHHLQITLSAITAKFTLQDQSSVAEDLKTGNGAKAYVRIDTPSQNNTNISTLPFDDHKNIQFTILTSALPQPA